MRVGAPTQLSMETTNRDSDVTHDRCLCGRGINLSNNREGNHIQQTDAQNSSSNNNSGRPPPAYPCREECIRCGKKIEVLNTDVINGQVMISLPGCSCECHENMQNQQPPESTVQMPTRNVPPTGANCLPGCGYSGLPCYNCSLLQAHLQPQNPNIGSPSIPSNQVPTFSPQIYTIELMEQPTVSREDPDQIPRHQQIIVENDDERNGKKMGVSLVFFTVFLIVFITIFKILFEGVGGTFW